MKTTRGPDLLEALLEVGCVPEVGSVNGSTLLAMVGKFINGLVGRARAGRHRSGGWMSVGGRDVR